MRKMKKLLCLVVVVCFAFSMVIMSNAAVPTTDTKKAVALQWYFVGPGPQTATGDVEAAANKYLKDKINATIKLNCLGWGDYEQKMVVKIASNEKFDICFTANWIVNYGLNSAKGAFVDLTDMFDKYAPKTKAILGPAVLKGSAINGKNYGIPTNKEMSHNWIVVYRRDIAKELGLDMSKVKSLADLEPIFKTVKSKKPTMYPFQTINGESAYRLLDFEKMVGDDVPGAIYGNGAQSTKIVNDFDTKEAKAYYTLMNKWYKAGWIRKDADTVTDYTQDPKAGKVFSLPQSGKPGKAAELEGSLNQQLAQVEITKPVQTTREMTGSINAISKTSSDPARALMFLEVMNSDKYINNLINYGIEGKQYVFVDKEKGIIKDGTKQADYALAMNWALGNQFLNYLKDNEDPQKWTLFKKFNDDGIPSPLLGFTYDQSKVKTQVAALTAIKKQYFPLIETGKGDYKKYLPIMLSKMKASGLDKVLADMQSQVNKFVAKK